jgi:membrane-bound serine protease (ClpP class)
MRHTVALALALIGFGGFLTLQVVSGAQASGSTAHLLVIDDAITPLEAKRLSSAVDDAEAANSHLLIVQLSTPGGLFDSTRKIVEEIFSSPVPIVVYIAPAGARAASAGTFIAAAAHVAAMAPATNIGAAAPVAADGDDLPDTIKAKATQDAAAFIRSIASQRDRNADALQDTVLKAASYSSAEALDLRVVNLTAENLADLLAQLHGMNVLHNGEQIQLDTEGMAVTEIERTPVDHFLSFLANPNIAFLLLTIGGIGIVIELFSPGLIGPGAVGVIALVLAFLAFGNLPVNWVGVGLIVLAMALFFAEAQAPGIGVFGITGAISFLLGAFLLFGNLSFSPQVPELPAAPSFTISIWVIGAISALLFTSMLLTLHAVRQARRTTPYYHYTSSNPDNLVGSIGTATTELNPSGSILVAGEQWSAVSDSGEIVSVGERVMIIEVDGLILKVIRESTFNGQAEQ